MMFLSSFIVYDKSLATRSVNRLRTVKAPFVWLGRIKPRFPWGNFMWDLFKEMLSIDIWIDQWIKGSSCFPPI